MKTLTKNRLAILGLVIVILVIGGINYWLVQEKLKIFQKELPEEKAIIEEIFSLSAVVLSINPENNFLIVKPAEEKRGIRVILSEDTKLIKLKFPFDPKNPSKETTFTPERTEIKISDFKEGDYIFIKSNEDILGKAKLNNIDFIEILP